MDDASPKEPPEYLAPYLRAARKYGAGFRSLLWASPQTQAIRFEAVARAIDLRGLRVLDVGCGRGDLHAFLLNRGDVMAEYIGVEAVPDLAAEARRRTQATIVEADFIREPARLFVGAEAVLFIGSLNTLIDDAAFESTLGHAMRAASKAVALNFLCDATRAGAEHLRFRTIESTVALFERMGTSRVTRHTGYLTGDATLVAWKG